MKVATNPRSSKGLKISTSFAGAFDDSPLLPAESPSGSPMASPRKLDGAQDGQFKLRPFFGSQDTEEESKISPSAISGNLNKIMEEDSPQPKESKIIL